MPNQLLFEQNGAFSEYSFFRGYILEGNLSLQLHAVTQAAVVAGSVPFVLGLASNVPCCVPWWQRQQQGQRFLFLV